MELIRYLDLSPHEIKNINWLLDEVEAFPHENKEEFKFASESEVIAHELPRRVRSIFHEFKRDETDIAIVIPNGLDLLWDMPSTPEKFIEREGTLLTLARSDIAHMLFSSLLWKPFWFRTQRYWHIINTIIAQRDKEEVSNNSAWSKYDFGFHTEDAFHHWAANHLGLLCMRNIESAPTTLSHINFSEIPEDVREELFKERFLVTSNTIHQNVMDAINTTRKSILFWNKNRPYFRINENTIDISQYSQQEQKALWWILDQLHKNRIDLVLKSWNFLYIDNYRVAHRRDAYVPNYWPELRWLKRVVTTNDLTKTSSVRGSSNSQIIENI